MLPKYWIRFLFLFLLFCIVFHNCSWRNIWIRTRRISKWSSCWRFMFWILFEFFIISFLFFIFTSSINFINMILDTFFFLLFLFCFFFLFSSFSLLITKLYSILFQLFVKVFVSSKYSCWCFANSISIILIFPSNPSICLCNLFISFWAIERWLKYSLCIFTNTSCFCFFYSLLQVVLVLFYYFSHL